MSNDHLALMLTVGFIVFMAVWVPLVEYCERKVRGRVESERGVEVEAAEVRSETSRGYEVAVLLTIGAAISSLLSLV